MACPRLGCGFDAGKCPGLVFLESANSHQSGHADSRHGKWKGATEVDIGSRDMKKKKPGAGQVFPILNYFVFIIVF